MNPEKRAFYEYHASLMEPWDGPAAVAFTDGRVDRRDARPQRPAPRALPGDARRPGDHGVGDRRAARQAGGRANEGPPAARQDVAGRYRAKAASSPTRRSSSALYGRQPYAQWLKENQITLDQLPEPPRVHGTDHDTILHAPARLRLHRRRPADDPARPWPTKGEEPIGSMGTDTPLACLSDKPQPLFNYFKQFFAQVTNPPIDPIREEMVMSLTSYIGTERNILDETPQHCHTLKLPHPILTNSRSGKTAPRVS